MAPWDSIRKYLRKTMYRSLLKNDIRVVNVCPVTIDCHLDAPKD